MEQATYDLTTSHLDELVVALAQLRGLAAVLARCALAGAPLEVLEAATLADAQRHALDAADALHAEARVEHLVSVARPWPCLSAAAAGLPLRVVAGLDHPGVGGGA